MMKHVSARWSHRHGCKANLRTSLVEMVRFFVPDPVVLPRPPRLWPPIGGLFVTSRVRMSRLFLGLNGFDPCLGYEFACRLLAVLEALFVKIPELILVGELDGPGRSHCGNVKSIVIVVNLATGAIGSLPLPRLIVTIIVEGVRVTRVATVHPPARELAHTIVKNGILTDSEC